MTVEHLATASLAIEAALLGALKESVALATSNPDEQLYLGGAVATLLMRHYYLACADPQGWLEGAVRAILQP